MNPSPWERVTRWADFTGPSWTKRAGAALALAVLPVILATFVLVLREARGPFWLGKNSDPDYAYLFNSLAVAQVRSPGHIDHPGTTLHVFGALVIRASYLIAGIGDLEEDVVEDPEFYLTNIHQSLLVVGALVLWACGVLTLWATRNLAWAVVSQLPPFLSTIVPFVLTGVWVELPLFFLTLAFATLTMIHLEGRLADRPNLLALLYGLLTGAALATKITAAPLAVVPLLLLAWRGKIGYVLSTTAAFLVAVVPILPKYKHFAEWIARLSTHTGAYGGGEKGFIDPARYLAGLRDLAWSECILFAILFVSAAVLVAWPVLRRRPGFSGGAGPAEFRGLLAVTLAEVLQILLVAKQPDPRYLVPALGLVGVNLVLLGKLGFRLLEGQTQAAFPRVAVSVIAALLVVQGWWSWKWHDYLTYDNRIQQELVEWLETEVGADRVIFHYSASSPVYALWFGNSCTASWDEEERGRYSERLQALYPGALFWDINSGRFYDFLREVDPHEIREAAAPRPLFLVGWAFDGVMEQYLPPGLDLQRISPAKQNLQEAAYRVGAPNLGSIHPAVEWRPRVRGSIQQF